MCSAGSSFVFPIRDRISFSGVKKGLKAPKVRGSTKKNSGEPLSWYASLTRPMRLRKTSWPEPTGLDSTRLDSTRGLSFS